MASSWPVLLQRGQRQTLFSLLVNSCRSHAATSPCHTTTIIRQFCSNPIPPTSTNQTGGGSCHAVQERDPGVYHLTQLFGKFLKSGEDRKAAELLDGMTSLDSPATVVVCNYLLNSCSKSRNAEMAKEVWRFMKANNVWMNDVSYGCMLCALSRGHCLGEAVDLLHLLYKKKEANVVMYNTVLNGCMHAKSKMYAARCVQLMEAQGVSKDALSYIELIKLAGMRGDLNATKKWWMELKKSFIPSPSTRSPYIIALSRMNALTEARQELQSMVSDLGLQIGTQPLDTEEGVHNQASCEVLSWAGKEKVEKVDGLGCMQSEPAGVSSNLNTLHRGLVKEPNCHVAGNQQKSLPFSGGQEEGHSLPKKAPAGSSIFHAELPSLGPRLPKNTSTSLKNLQNAYNSIINAAGKSGDHVLAESLFTEITSNSAKYLPSSPFVLMSGRITMTSMPLHMNMVRGLLCTSKRFSVCDNKKCESTPSKLTSPSVLSQMRQLGLKTDIYTYNALLRAVVEGRGVQHALRIVRRMEASGLQPDVHSLTALLEGYCQKRQLNKAEDVLKYMEQGGHSQKPTCYAFNILLKACATAEDPLRALRVFAMMKEAGVMPDNCTYATLLSACGSAKTGVDGNSQWSRQEVAKRVTAIEMDMAQSGVLHTHESLTTVMRVLGAEGLTEAMLQRLQDASEYGKSLLDASSFNTVILSCLNAKQVETGWDVYHQMKLSGVKPDVYTYNILINGCAHDKSVATAFQLVDTMCQEGLSPDVVTFNSLLKVVCHSGEMEVVLDLLQKMIASGVQPDSATFNTILTSASYHKRLDVTEHVVEEMRRRHILPDQHTLLPVVSMYMHVGQTDDAVEALRVLSLRMLDRNNKTEENEFKDAKTRQIQDVLGDLARKNLNLQEDTRALLMDAVLHTSPESLAVYTAALTGLVHGENGSGVHEQSSWTTRLSTQYDKRKTAKFAKSDTM